MTESIDARLQQLADLAADVSGKKTNVYITAFIAPLAYALLLYISDPKFLRTRDGTDSSVRNTAKWAAWTGILTLLTWGGLYVYWQYADI
jgi:hypothetical protein